MVLVNLAEPTVNLPCQLSWCILVAVLTRMIRQLDLQIVNVMVLAIAVVASEATATLSVGNVYDNVAERSGVG